MSTDLIVLTNPSASNGGPAVLSEIDPRIRPGERVAWLGLSRLDKSTLHGSIDAREARRLALLPQAAAPARTLSVFHDVHVGRLDRHPLRRNRRAHTLPARADPDEVGCVLGRMEGTETIGAKGRRRRVSVERALCNGRTSLFAEDPLSFRDPRQGAAVLDAQSGRRETPILAFHDVVLAVRAPAPIASDRLSRWLRRRPYIADSPKRSFRTLAYGC